MFKEATVLCRNVKAKLVKEQYSQQWHFGSGLFSARIKTAYQQLGQLLNEIPNDSCIWIVVHL